MAPSSNQPKSFLKKWLPAIGLALFVHLVILIIFLNNSVDSSKTVQDSKHKTTLEVDSKNEVNNKSQNLPPLKTLSSNQTESNTVTHILAETNNEASQQSSTSNDQAPPNFSADQSKIIATNSFSNMKSSATGSSEIDDKETLNTSNPKQGVINKPDTAVKVDDKMVNATSAMGNKSSQYTASDIPKTVITQDDLLLKRERVATDDTSSEVMAEYDRIAQQAEKETERLSRTINQIKEENRRQIGIEQQRQMSTYIENNQELSEEIDKVSNELGLGELAEEEFAEVE